VVPALTRPGQTFSLTWVADRPGNWLMHCHMAAHMSPNLRGRPPASSGTHLHNHTLEFMAGIVTGWRVVPAAHGSPRTKVDTAGSTVRKLRLLAQSVPGFYDSSPGLGFVLQDGAVPSRPDSVVIPGPSIILTRGEPVQITVVNRLSEATSIHWHGIELDSYFDGVSGWSGEGGRTAPPVMARDSFAVRFTPPRAGTFIYHSHFNEERQLASGMYGPLIVLEPGTRYDPETDKNWVLSQGGPARVGRVILNGSSTPVLHLQATKRYRIRLINISPNVPLTLSVLADSMPVHWRAIAKDGADLPAAQAVVLPAKLTIGVGETYDFEFTPEAAGELRLLAIDAVGRTRLSGVVRIEP
jgi:manganese oxidase